MAKSHRPERLAELIRKIDEVRALSNLPPLELGSKAASIEATMEALVEAAAPLATEVEHHRRRLIEATVLLAAISEFLSAIVLAGNPEPALTSLCHFLRGAFRLDWVHLGILDSSGTQLGGPVVRTEPGGGVRDGRLAQPWPKAGPLERVMSQHRTEILRHPELKAAPLEGPRASALRLVACLPVGRPEPHVPGLTAPGATSSQALTPDPARGVLVLGRYSAQEFDRNHLALLESLAASVGTALDNARLTQRLGDAIRFRDHVLESMIDGVVAVDREGRVLVMNEVAESLLLLPRQQALGRPFPRGLLEDRDPSGDPLEEALAKPFQTRRSEGWICAPGRERRPARLTTTRLRDESGLAYGTLVTFFDLTPIREMERRIRHLDRIATLGRFTSSVAHEIRNPLAGIAAGVEYLKRSIPAGDPANEHLEFVAREVGRLDRIVSDLSRATRPSDPRPQPIHIETVTADAVQAIRSRPEALSADIETEFRPNLPEALVDPDHLSQVLVNLLLNAIQAGGGCPVTVRAWVTPRTAGGRRRLWVAVDDSGPGIPADNLDRIFEPFFTTKKDGTGLGLYICHEMVKRNGGEITVENLSGGGARFLIELPVSQHPASGQARNQKTRTTSRSSRNRNSSTSNQSPGASG
jgi:PAS domain S-box-containing protein